jgi:hypothetical protein
MRDVDTQEVHLFGAILSSESCYFVYIVVTFFCRMWMAGYSWYKVSEEILNVVKVGSLYVFNDQRRFHLPCMYKTDKYRGKE